MYDILIRNGRILDPVIGLDCVSDLAINQGKIRGIGNFDGAAATQTVDATGCYVTPGLID